MKKQKEFIQKECKKKHSHKDKNLNYSLVPFKRFNTVTPLIIFIQGRVQLFLLLATMVDFPYLCFYVCATNKFMHTVLLLSSTQTKNYYAVETQVG